MKANNCCQTNKSIQRDIPCQIWMYPASQKKPELNLIYCRSTPDMMSLSAKLMLLDVSQTQSLEYQSLDQLQALNLSLKRLNDPSSV